MRDISNEIKVGAVVILAIVILLYAIVWVKEYGFAMKRYDLVVSFPEVGTLEIGDPVSVLGVNKGEVKEIKLDGKRVSVTLSLANDVQLYEGAEVKVTNVGLMGERFVAIHPGESESPLDTKLPLYGRYDTGISEVFGMMGEIITEVRSLIAALEGTFGENGQAAKIRQLIDDLHQLADNANTFFNDNSESMKNTINDLSQAAGSMREFVDSNNANMSESAANIAEFSSKMNELTDRLNRITTDIEQGEGTLGKTLADDSLYYDLKNMVNDLDSLITDFKKNPKRYVKVSVF